MIDGLNGARREYRGSAELEQAELTARKLARQHPGQPFTVFYNAETRHASVAGYERRSQPAPTPPAPSGRTRGWTDERRKYAAHALVDLTAPYLPPPEHPAERRARELALRRRLGWQ